MRKSKFCKKLICILSCVATCASVFAPISVSAATIYPEYSSAVYDTNITRPYWESDVIFNEVCCPIGRWKNLCRNLVGKNGKFKIRLLLCYSLR